MKKKPGQLGVDQSLKQASSKLLRSFDDQNHFKQLSFRNVEKSSNFLEDSVFDPKSTKHKARMQKKFSSQNDKFRFFQGDQSIFSKEFMDDQSKYYQDQSTILTSKDLFTSADQLTFHDDEVQQNNPKYQLLKNIDKRLEELSNSLKNPDRQVILDILENLQTDAKEVKDNYNLFLRILELKGKIVRDIGDYQRSISVLKQARLYCNISKNYEKKLYFYRLILDMYISIREYDNAIIFAKKMLRLAWIINDVDYEIIAYDKIGMIKYYQGDLLLADYFHEKAFSNTREPKNSQIRKVGESIIRKKKSYNTYSMSNFETDSEDDFDLGVFQNIFLRKRSIIDLQSLDKSSSLPSFKQKIPVPRIVNEHIREQYSLGRVDIPIEKKKDFLTEQDNKYIYNQLSLNRNLKNFMIQQYVNSGYWAGSQDQLSKIKFYHLHRNIKNLTILINKIRKYSYSLRINLKFENLLDQQHDNSIIQNPNNNRSSIIVNEDYFPTNHKLNLQSSQAQLLLPSYHNLESTSNFMDQKIKTRVSLIPTLPRINNNSSMTNLALSKTPTSNRLNTHH